MAASYDETLRYGAQTPFSDQLAFHLEGGNWQVDPNHDSIIAAGNGGGKPVKARLTFFYAGGAKRYRIEQTIAPDDQMWIDVGKLIRNGIPDKDGNVLPPDLTTGAYQLRDLAETPSPSLYEGKVVTDKTYGHATYGCMVCCGYRAAGFNPDPVFAGVDYFAALDVQGMSSCSGSGFNWINLDGYAASWSSDDTAIMTVQPRSAGGVSVGSTTARSELVNIQYGPPRDGQTCPVQNVPVQGPGNVVYPTASTIVGSTYTGLYNCGTNETGHERNVWEQILDNETPPRPFAVDGITIGETVTPTSRDDFHWGHGLQTGSGPTSYQNAPGTPPLHGVFQDKLVNCDPVLNKCLGGGGGGLESILTQQLTYAGIPVPAQNQFIEVCTGFTVNGK